MAKRVFKNGLVDEGFEPVYFNLSHRRRMFRTLWVLPLGLVFLLPPIDEFTRVKFHVGGWVLLVLTVVFGAAQFGYEYWMWNRDEREQ